MKKIVIILCVMVACTLNIFTMEQDSVDGAEETLRNGLRLSKDNIRIIAHMKIVNNDDDDTETTVSFDLVRDKFRIDCSTYEPCFCGLFDVCKDKKIIEQLKNQIKEALRLMPKEIMIAFIQNDNRKEVDDFLWKL